MAGLRPALAKLAQQPERLTHARIWLALTRDEREQAVVCRLEAPDSWALRDLFLEELATLWRFRKATLSTWPANKLASYTARADGLSREIVSAFLVQWHLSERSPLLIQFLNTLRIPHQGGLCEGTFDEPPAGAGEIREAADALIQTYPADDVFIYLLSLSYLYPAAFRALAPWLRERAVDTPHPERGDGTAVSVESEPDDTARAADSGLVKDPEGFTTLDARLVRVVVDAAQGIEGAPTEDELDDLVEEVIHLNSERQRSYFHLGFRDSVFKRPRQGELVAENQLRRRWYLAGFISGLARRQAWEDVAGVYDSEPLAKDLGESGRGASSAAASIIFTALCHVNRPAEAARFVKPLAVARLLRPLGRSMLEVGKQLLRSERPSEAKLVLSTLSAGVREAAETGFSLGADFDHEVQRRLAHAHRQLGEVGLAKEILTRLMSQPDLDRPSSIISDLGILECGYRRLADIQVPLEREDVAPFKEILERGRPYFEGALQVDDLHDQHAHYCLGVLDLVMGHCESAVLHLDEAVSRFSADPDAYRPGGLLTNAKLYLGLAICHALDVGRMERAHELIREACRERAKIPPHMVASTVAALEMVADDLGRGVAEAILEAGGPEVLDGIVASTVTRSSRPVASAVLTRSRDEKRGLKPRVQDCHVVLPLLLHQQRFQEAGEVLDTLQSAALHGEGHDRFLALLGRPEAYEPAWDRDDASWARIECLEAFGGYEEARIALAREFHRVFAAREYGYTVEGEAILERIESYGPPADATEHLRRRLEAETRLQERTSEPERDSRRVVRILVVGGNETQAQYDTRIRDELNRSYPWIEVDFQHTGWTSNWGCQLDDIRRRLPQYDALVVMRLIRTMLGRGVRAACGSIPWRGCGGKGMRAILNSIVLAAGMTNGKIRLAS